MGCGIACAAFLLGVPYKKAKSMFKNPEYSVVRGFYCREIIKVLNDNGLNYSFSKFEKEYEKIKNQPGVIIFIESSNDLPGGHFLVRTKNSWMSSWINFPCIAPAKSGFQKKLPGKVQWIIYPKLIEK